MRYYQFSGNQLGRFYALVGLSRTVHCGMKSASLIRAMCGAAHGSNWLAVYEDNKLIFHREISGALKTFAATVDSEMVGAYSNADSAAYTACLKMGWNPAKDEDSEINRAMLQYINPIIEETLNEHRRKVGPEGPEGSNGKPVQATGQPAAED